MAINQVPTQAPNTKSRLLRDYWPRRRLPHGMCSLKPGTKAMGDNVLLMAMISGCLPFSYPTTLPFSFLCRWFHAVASRYSGQNILA